MDVDETDATLSSEAEVRIPVTELIRKLGLAVAHAQLELTKIGVEIGELLASAQVTFPDENGQSVTRSLLELGFLPSFYEIGETEIDVALTLGLAAHGEDGDANSADETELFGVVLSPAYHRKYDFDAAGASRLRARLVNVPPPAEYVAALRGGDGG